MYDAQIFISTTGGATIYLSLRAVTINIIEAIKVPSLRSKNLNIKPLTSSSNTYVTEENEY